MKGESKAITWMTQILFLVTCMLICRPGSCLNITSDFESIRLKKEMYCLSQDIRESLNMTYYADLYRNSSTNFLQGFAKGTFQFLFGSSLLEGIVGLLPGIAIGLLVFIAILVTQVFNCVVLCRDCCKPRKEHMSILKQRILFYSAIVLILGLALAFVLFNSYAKQAEADAAYAACFYYYFQYELIKGFNNGDYVFVGFDNINKNIEIFKKELVNFPSLKPYFSSINSVNFTAYKNQPLDSAFRYAYYYGNSTVLTPTRTLRKPIFVESLTKYITDAVEVEFKSIQATSQSLLSIVSYGNNILDKYDGVIDILVTSLTTALTYVVDKFEFILNKLLIYDSPLETLINVISNIEVFIIVLGILMFAFVPFFVTFYMLTNSSDKYQWFPQTARIVNMLFNILALALSIIFIMVLFFGLIVSGGCYYIGQIQTNPNFPKTVVSELQITDENAKLILTNCFNKNTSNFDFFLNNNNNSTDSGNSSNLDGVRRRPNISYLNSTDVIQDNSAMNNTSNSTVADEYGDIEVGTGRRLAAIFLDNHKNRHALLQHYDENDVSGSHGFLSFLKNEFLKLYNGRRLQTQAATNTATGNTNAANITANGTTTNTTTNTTTTTTTTTATVKLLPGLPSGFDTTLLGAFQSFLQNIFNYYKFYESSLSEESPSISSVKNFLADLQTGVQNSFLEYQTMIDTLNKSLKLCNIELVLNIRQCSTASSTSAVKLDCVEIPKVPLQDFSAKLAGSNDCLDDKTSVLEKYQLIQDSFNAGALFYQETLTNLTSPIPQYDSTNPTPGSAALAARRALLNIKPAIDSIKTTLSSTLGLLAQYNGTLSGLTSCYIMKREISVVEPTFCFKLQASLFNMIMYMLIMCVLLFIILWLVFFSINYSGNMTIGSWASKTTLGSGWQQSKQSVASFIQNSEIIVDDKSKLEDDENEKNYFEDSDDDDEK